MFGWETGNGWEVRQGKCLFHFCRGACISEFHFCNCITQHLVYKLISSITCWAGLVSGATAPGEDISPVCTSLPLHAKWNKMAPSPWSWWWWGEQEKMTVNCQEQCLSHGKHSAHVCHFYYWEWCCCSRDSHQDWHTPCIMPFWVCPLKWLPRQTATLSPKPLRKSLSKSLLKFR